MAGYCLKAKPEAQEVVGLPSAHRRCVQTARYAHPDVLLRGTNKITSWVCLHPPLWVSRHKQHKQHITTHHNITTSHHIISPAILSDIIWHTHTHRWLYVTVFFDFRIFYDILCAILSDIFCVTSTHIYTHLRRSPLSSGASGSAHWNLELAVVVR